MNGFVAGQYFELWEGEGMAVGVEVDEVLYDEDSQYQELLVFKRYVTLYDGYSRYSIVSKTFGNVMVIDETVQCTERDEFPYSEMMAHLPLFSHPHPKKVSSDFTIYLQLSAL